MDQRSPGGDGVPFLHWIYRVGNGGGGVDRGDVHRDPNTPSDWPEKLARWIPLAISFIEAEIQAPLPYRDVQLIQLPPYSGDPGATLVAMCTLSDLHSSSGDVIFEENWVHELGHL